MQRVSALWQASPRKLVGALFILMMVAMMAVASGASFTSTSANVGNIVTAGTLTHSNTTANADTSILNVDNLMPGHSAAAPSRSATPATATASFTLDQEQRSSNSDRGAAVLERS